MPRLLPVLATALALALAPSALAADAQLVQVPGSYDNPLYVTAPPGDRSRLLIVEQGGRVQLLKDGVKQATPYLDISSLGPRVGGEEGLLSIALAPDYATSGKLFAYYTNSAGNLQIDEFTRSTADLVPVASRRPVVTVPHPRQGNHNGGQLQFGPDGFLYAATGDGGGANDVEGNSRDFSPTNHLGKMLRIDPATFAVSNFAYGLRNPWRFSFDRLTGDLVIADVGQGEREEVNFAPRNAGGGQGVDWGWVCFEGTLQNVNAPGGLCNPPNDSAPVLEETHDDGWCSITGGYVVRDPSLSTLAGRYVYGDFCKAEIWTAALQSPRVSDKRRVTLTGSRTTVPALASFGEDAAGCVYVASKRAAPDGAVFRLAPEGGPALCPEAPSPGPGPGPTPSPGPAPGPSPAPTPGGSALAVGATGKRLQRYLARRVIRLAVKCSEACTLVPRGTVKVKGREPIPFTGTLTRLAGGRRTVLEIALPKTARLAVLRALNARRTALVQIAVRARDSDGLLDVASRKVRLVR